VVNWGEVYYSIWRSRGEKTANEKLREISQLPIEVIDVDMPTAKLAARFKAECKLPHADCFAAALAQQRKSVLVTSDHDFKAVESCSEGMLNVKAGRGHRRGLSRGRWSKGSVTVVPQGACPRTLGADDEGRAVRWLLSR
jgi:hypothetical protein